MTMPQIFKRKLQTLITNPTGAIIKYFKIIVLRQILPIYREDYGKHWGFTSFKDKIVLDFGADYGSTTYYFLKQKAFRVIAVEGDLELYRKLIKNYGKNRSVHCHHKMVLSSQDFKHLLKKYSADIVKVDIEGAEKYLLNVPSILILKFNEWLIETHNANIASELQWHFTKLDFTVSLTPYSDGSTVNQILYAHA